ncbi:MAG: flagellar hook-length control protein FliK [Rhodocyclales bacterium]|nr:flagellar hook-length control protein FliK [Rhodocyclales bacterium]MDB5888643.1 flagellar hook-length control protein FliK [Rhodocyclales bacterium]
MIPADLASRLRLLIDSEVKSLVRVQDIPSDLPDLETGQRFSAKIESPLPDGTFRALVAGRTVTLAVPNSAKSGDVLELVVTGTNDKTITARLADPAEPTTAALQPKLSPAGQLISQLLTGRQGETPAATLNRNEPLLPGPPTKASTLTPLLRQAVSESGLFYESHQAQWVEGETPLESLLREPQARVGTLLPSLAPQASILTSPQGTAPGSQPPLPEDAAAHAAAQGASQSSQSQATPSQNAKLDLSPRAATPLTENDNGIQRTRAGDDTPPAHSTALKIADQLMPLVHQQLDTLATHQAMWQGQVWPGQTMQWQIFDPEGQPQSSSEQGDGNEPAPWQSTLRLKMPRLGGIEAQLIVTAAGVAVRVSADTAQAAQQLQDGSEALGNALEAAGVPMTGFAAQHVEAT